MSQAYGYGSAIHKYLTAEELEQLADPSAFTGMAGSQCTRYLHDVIKPILEQNRANMQRADEINV